MDDAYAKILLPLLDVHPEMPFGDQPVDLSLHFHFSRTLREHLQTGMSSKGFGGDDEVTFGQYLLETQKLIVHSGMITFFTSV